MRDLKSRRGGGISRRCENTGMRLSVEHVFCVISLENFIIEFIIFIHVKIGGKYKFVTDRIVSKSSELYCGNTLAN